MEREMPAALGAVAKRLSGSVRLLSGPSEVAMVRPANRLVAHAEGRGEVTQ